MKNKIILSSIAAVALLSLSGCGGSSSTPVEEPSQKSSISGVAVDDLILNGIVTATKVNGDVLVTDRTSSTDGSYTLNVDYAGVVLLNVTCDEDSTMLNPETNETMACESDVELNSLADVTAGVDMTVNISPLTEIVYQRATEQAGDVSAITADNIEDSRYDIGLMFGVDPLGDNPTEGASAEIIGSIHALAEDENRSVMDVTEDLAGQLADGVADGGDTTVASLTDVMDDENITNNLTDNDGEYTPPETPATRNDVEETKALFTELRTQAMSVVDYNNSGTPGFLDTEALSLEEAMNDVVMNTEFIGAMMNEFVDGIMYAEDNNLTLLNKAISETRSVRITKSGVGTWGYIMIDMNSDATWRGVVKYSEIDEKFNPYTFTTLDATLVGDLPLDYNPIVEDGVEDSQSFYGEFTITKTTSGADMTLNGDVFSNGTTITLSNTTAELGYEAGVVNGDIEPVFNYFKLNTLTVQGEVDTYTIDGSIVVNSYVQNAGMATQGGFTEIYTTDFGGQVYCTDGSDYAYGYVEITLDDVTHRAYTNDNGYFNTDINGQYDWDDFEAAFSTVSFENTCPMGATPQVNLDYVDSHNEGDFANSGWVANDVTFAGAISRTGASIDGTLNAKWLNAATKNLESETEKPEVDVDINGKLKMPERPEMLVTLTFENTQTTNTVGASYSYDATVINLTADFDAEMENGDIAVTTHTGLLADFKVVNGDLVTDGTGTVTKDGSLVGTLEERSDLAVLKYIDGSFESLP